MKIFLLLAFYVLSITCMGQDWPSKEFIIRYNYEKVVPNDLTNSLFKSENFTPAMYPSGNQGLINFIKKEIKFPNTKEKPENGGKVFLSFVVNREGNIGDVKVIQSAGEKYDEEAIRAIRKMERWIPAKLSYRDINVQYIIPIDFL